MTSPTSDLRPVRRPAPETKPAARLGMTLMELLLVLALLVTVAAMSLPALEGPMQDHRLVKSADQVRAAWCKARVEAMQTGRVQMFRYEPGGARYRIQPWYADSDYDELDLETMQQDQFAMAAAAPASASETAVVEEKELPEGVTFHASQAAASARDASIEQSLSAAGLSNDQWSQPILFYPDGASSTVRVVLQNERNAFVTVKLRGLTGLAQVSDLMTAEELPQ